MRVVDEDGLECLVMRCNGRGSASALYTRQETIILIQVVITIYLLISFIADRVPANPELLSSSRPSFRRMPSLSGVYNCLARHIRALSALNSDVSLH